MTELLPIDAYDQASLEAFTSELIADGFEPESGTALRSWTGPAHPALAPLTDAVRMRLIIRDGWPVVFPMLFVEGLHTNHLTPDGYVCLWHEGDGSLDWLRLDNIYGRLVEWCDAAQNGWDPEGLGRDAYLNFQTKLATAAIVDTTTFPPGAAGTRSVVHGQLEPSGCVLLCPGIHTAKSDLQGIWYRLGDIKVPPRNLSELRGILARQHGRDFDRALAARRGGALLQPSGSVDLVLLSWNSENAMHLLVLALEGTGDETTGVALQLGPNDRQSLMLRAGPDYSALADKTVTIFGLGALGGHVAVVLAQSGVTCLRLFDSDVLLPENMVRHAGGHLLVGASKVGAAGMLIRDHAPWTDVSASVSRPMAPTELNQAISGSDLVVDATGVEGSTNAICLGSQTQSRALVSGTLYRGGSIARVRRQGTPGDTPILARMESSGYATIPLGQEDLLVHPTVGCSGPVHNAPPTSVLAGAALIAQAAVDVLTERFLLPDEVIDVYRPLPAEPPFDVVGRLYPSR